MATMIKEVYDALLEAGASEDKAGKAAEASYDNRFNKIEKELAKLESKINQLQWMVGLVIVVVVIPLLKDLFS